MSDASVSSRFSFSARSAHAQQQPISYLMSLALDNPELISLAAGFVDYTTLPAVETADLLAPLLKNTSLARTALQYGTTQGLEPLRQVLLEHLAALDGVQSSELGVTVNDLVITTGSQQLLFILTDILVDRGDIVITEWPSYFVYTGLLESFGAQVRCVEMDADGLIPEKLDELLGQLKKTGELNKVKILYTCDYHQNPTGITLSPDRRPQVLDIVRRYSTDHRILVIEDAAYRELTYEGAPPTSIKKHDRNNEFVALVQTFSKPFSPGMKTGYGLLPRDLVEPVVAQKSGHDFGSVNLIQHLLLEVMRQGVYARHVSELCAAYTLKRDAALAALDQHIDGFGGDSKSGATWTHPQGGMYVHLTLPPSIDTGRKSALFGRAIDHGVLYVPGEYCFGPDPDKPTPRNTIRLSFGVPSVEQIKEGVARLAQAVSDVM